VGFLIPLVLIFAHLWKLEGVFISFPSADILTFFLTIGLAIPVLKRFRKIATGQRKLAPDSPEAPMPFHVPEWKSTKNT